MSKGCGCGLDEKVGTDTSHVPVPVVSKSLQEDVRALQELQEKPSIVHSSLVAGRLRGCHLAEMAV